MSIDLFRRQVVGFSMSERMMRARVIDVQTAKSYQLDNALAPFPAANANPTTDQRE